MGEVWGDDLLYRGHSEIYPGKQNDPRDENPGEILHPAIAEGVLFVRRPARQLGAQNGDDGGQGVAEVVHGVQDDGDGVGQQAHRHFEGHQTEVGPNGHQAGSDDEPVPDML